MKVKKLAALTAAAVVSMMSVIPVSAADGDASITVDGTAKEYKAYRLMDLTTKLKGGCGHDASAHTKDCYDYLYTVSSKYATVIRTGVTNAGLNFDKNADGNVTDNELKVGLSGMTEEQTRKFADAMQPLVKGMTADETTTTKSFDNVPQGWYLIAESVKADGTDSYSLAILDTHGQSDVTITAKEGVPTVTKKILVTDADGDTTKVDASDAAKGDTVNYETTVTLPDNVENFSNYWFTVHDKSTGIDLDGGITIYVDGTEATLENATTETVDDGCMFHKTVKLNDLRVAGAAPTITKDTKIVLKYSGKIKETGFINTNKGNVNETWLDFACDPYNNTEKESTPHDKVATFTYTIKTDKVDMDKNPLNGSGFTLYKKDGIDYTTEVGTGNTGTSFTFQGLGPGDYKLVETTVPDGYTKADDLFFTIRGVYEKNTENPELTGLEILNSEGTVISTGDDASFSVDIPNASATTEVVNVRGVRLPGTGATSLMVLTIGGAIVVLGGCGALFALKRKKEA